MPRTRRRKGGKRVTRKKGGGKTKARMSGSVGVVKNGSRFYSTIINGKPVLVPLTPELESKITSPWSMFRNKNNTNTLQVRDGQLVMMNSLGKFKKVSIIYVRGHGEVIGAFKCPVQTAVINTGKSGDLTHKIFSKMAPIILQLLFRGKPDKNAIDNFKNFLQLKSGYSLSYGPDSLINSVSYTTPGTTMKNVRLTKDRSDLTNDVFNPYRGVFDVSEAVKSDTIKSNHVTDEEYELPLDDVKFTTTLGQIIALIGSAITGGPARSDITNTPSKYKNIHYLTKKMESEAMGGTTTEEILLHLRGLPEYKDNIIFLIVFACGEWGWEVYQEGEREKIFAAAAVETNFGVPTEGEVEPEHPIEYPPGYPSLFNPGGT